MNIKFLLIITFLLSSFYSAECSDEFVNIDKQCYKKSNIDVLQDFIDLNPSLKNLEPLNIGYQEWTNKKLTYLYLGDKNISVLPDSIGLLKGLISLDLRNNSINTIPESICNIYPYYSNINLDNNIICPPYPYCYDYIDNQKNNKCNEFSCPKNYTKINEICYFNEHLQILQNIININTSLAGLKPLDLGKEIGHIEWKHGKLIKLNLVANGLTKLPTSLCSIYEQLDYFDVSLNSICAPYPDCFEFIGYQNTENCNYCNKGYIYVENSCYYKNDYEFIKKIYNSNESLKIYRPLTFGHQFWQHGRLIELGLNNLEINIIPDEINQLEMLQYLNLNDNEITSLPENLCDIYPNLKYFEIANNKLCPPHIKCFDYLGRQQIDNCEKHFCPYGFTDLNEQCYSDQDLAILNDFISLNKSLDGKNPLEIGIQKWKNMRLNYLYLGVNNLTTVPKSICTILPNLNTFNVSQNNVCPPYPECIEKIIGEQNAASCP